MTTTRTQFEVVYRFEADLTNVVPIGLVPEGIRFDVAFRGKITAGALAGRPIEGIDYLLLRADGVGVIDAREQIESVDGRAIALHAQGYVVPPNGLQLPPPDVLLSPDFRWPDLSFSLHGAVFGQCGSPEWAWLNRSVLAFAGWVNLGTSRLLVTSHALNPIP